MVFFESKEIKDFRKKHFDDMTAANSLISNLRFSQGTVQGYDEFMMNLEHILEFRRLMLIEVQFVPEMIDLLTFLFIRYIANSTIPILEKDRDGAGKNVSSLQRIRRQCDLVLNLVTNSKDIVPYLFEMKKNGSWPDSFNETNWLSEFKSPDSFLKWTLSKTNDGNPKLIFASGKIMAKIGSLFRLIDAFSRL